MVNFSMMTFLFFIVLPIGLCVLEIFLSRMDNKYIGLILPAITFIYSLIALLSFAIFDGATTGEIVVSMLTTFLGTNLLTVILCPLNWLFSLWKKLLNRVFRLESDNKMSQEELLMLVDEVQQEGSIDGSEGELLKNAIEFTEREAEDILTHRVDMEAVSKDASKEDIAKVFSETKYSRLPVYDGDIDNIIGVIHQKDFYTGNGIIDRDISHIIAPAVYVLKNEKISSILKLLQRKKAHVAVVLDEYGGTCGMITMEDILEELVGEIWDEHDEITETVQQTGENSFTVDGAMDMDDFVGYFGIKADTDATSAGGWITEQLGHIPEAGDTLEYENLNIKVLSMDNHRIEKFRIDRVCRAKAEAGISE